MRRTVGIGLLCLCGAVSAQAAGATDGGVPGPSDAGRASDAAPSVSASCVEHLTGAERPKLEEKVPPRGTSGHVLTLELVIVHGKGEKVLPNGFRIDRGSDEARALKRAGFILPDPEGGAAPHLKTESEGDRATTTVTIPFVALPDEPGRHELVLPPLPIAIARASGEVSTLCTRPHAVIIEDPTSSTPNARPLPNPPPRPQREEWTLAKNVATAALIALVVGVLLAWLLGRWLRRPKPEPPPPPPRPPWEVALEELFDIRHAGLITDQRFQEHYDRVSHAVRKYLGDRYGFDGLESTTREIMAIIERIVPPVTAQPEIWTFLREADLVKFARLTPSQEDCETALGRGEQIVRTTVPPFVEAGAGAAAPAESAPPEPDSGGGAP
ncbi:MAG: hypothetical protein OZ921_12810 [Sorangiineae bacterium]|nr:hypothetical protein [Polyangiaceae bacterium]MEB2323388.1 hypothetical protein [Sorangiineae bacterium]